VPVENFREQMKSLAEMAYHTILPDQLDDYLLRGAPLPTKPVMISTTTLVWNNTPLQGGTEQIRFKGYSLS
jgi:hypothetical protein